MDRDMMLLLVDHMREKRRDPRSKKIYILQAIYATCAIDDTDEYISWFPLLLDA
jgi:hypothetical protein